MSDDLDRLDKLAEAATPGPWSGGVCRAYRDEDGKRRGAGSVRREGGAIVFMSANGPEILEDDVKFIAAANPAVVRALVQRVRDAEARRHASPPVELAMDVWMALGLPASEFDGYYERNGWADTWANLLHGHGGVNTAPACGADTGGETCVLRAGGHMVHHGASDVGSSESLPGVEADCSLQAERDAALAREAKVRELHMEEIIAVHESYGPERWCPRCREHYPCATIRALDADGKETNE